MQQLSILFEQLPWHKWSLEYNLRNAVPVNYVILACCYCSLNHQHRSGCEGSLTLYLRIWHLISIQFKFSLTLPQTICKCEPPGDKWEWGMLNKPPISLCFSISKWSCQTRILLLFFKKLEAGRLGKNTGQEVEYPVLAIPLTGCVAFVNALPLLGLRFFILYWGW